MGTVFGMAAGTFSAASLQLPQEKAEALDPIVSKTYADTVMTDDYKQKVLLGVVGVLVLGMSSLWYISRDTGPKGNGRERNC